MPVFYCSQIVTTVVTRVFVYLFILFVCFLFTSLKVYDDKSASFVISRRLVHLDKWPVVANISASFRLLNPHELTVTDKWPLDSIYGINYHGVITPPPIKSMTPELHIIYSPYWTNRENSYYLYDIILQYKYERLNWEGLKSMHVQCYISISF